MRWPLASPTLTLADGWLVAETRNWRRGVDSERIAVGSATDLAAGLVTLRSRPRRVELRLGDPYLQRRCLAGLPPVRTRQLRELVAHDAGRFFRQNGHPLVTDAVWLPKAPDGSRAALAVAADTQVLNELLAALAASGFEVRALRAAGVTSVARMNLLPTAHRVTRARADWRVTRRLLALAGALWIGTGGYAAVGFLREREQIHAELDRLARPLDALREVRGDMSRADAMLGAVAASDRDRRLLARRLIRLGQALPDSLVLTGLTLEIDGSGRLTGLARAPLAVVARLEAAGVVANPRLAGGTMREVVRGSSWERFAVTFGPGARR